MLPTSESTLFPYTTLFRSNLQFGLDHLIYGSAAGNGGEVRPGNDPEAKPVPFAGYDFCFARSEEHTSELQSLRHLVCRLLLEKKKRHKTHTEDLDRRRTLR